LMLLTHRYYEPGVGRFVTSDPERDGGNWYEYVGNNAPNAVDPIGLFQIGPVPPGTVVPPHEKGLTSCDPDSGKMWTIIVDRTCAAPCLDAHEGQHRYDLSKCCARLKKCIDRYGPRGRRRCIRKWNDWTDAIRNWAECRAYRSGRHCIEKMIKKRNCWCVAPGKDPCCDVLKLRWVIDNNLVANYCEGISNPWAAPPPQPCPFRASGEIR
jgi:hypothetical protein